MLSLDTLPWIVMACALARLALTSAKASRVQGQLRMTQDRLSDAVARLECARATDDVTGLATRARLEDRLDATLLAAHEESRAVGVLFLGLDRFKRINATLGHAAGDRVLREAAQRLVACVRPGDLVARFGGDEFVVVVELVERREDLENLAAAIQRAMQPAFVVDGHEALVTASIGIAISPGDGLTSGVLLANASIAMDHAKEQAQAVGAMVHHLDATHIAAMREVALLH